MYFIKVDKVVKNLTCYKMKLVLFVSCLLPCIKNEIGNDLLTIKSIPRLNSNSKLRLGHVTMGIKLVMKKW